MQELSFNSETNIKLIEQLVKIAKSLAPVNILPNTLLNIKQISELYNLDARIIRSAIENGELNARRNGKGLTSRFVSRQRDVEEYINNIFDADFVEDSTFFNHKAITKRLKKT